MGSDDRGTSEQPTPSGRRGDRFGALTWLADDPAPGLVPGDDADFAPAEGLVGSFEPAGVEPSADAGGEQGSDVENLAGSGVFADDAVAVADDADTFTFAEDDTFAVPDDAREITGDAPDAGLKASDAAALDGAALDHATLDHATLDDPTLDDPTLDDTGAGDGGGAVDGEADLFGDAAADPVLLGGVAGTAVAASGDDWRSPRPLPAALPPKKRRWPLVLAAFLALAALGGAVAGLAARDRTGTAGSETSASSASAASVTTAAAAAADAGPVTTAPATTTPDTTSAAATTSAPATSAASTVPATTAAAGAVTVAPAAADDAVDLFTPVRWAIFDKGKVQLLGRVPSQAAADTIAGKAAGVVGKDNVQVSYTIDPTAPLPPSAPLYVKDLVLFDESSAALHEESFGLLDLGVTLMQQNPGVRIRVVGRADNRGDANKNLLLSLDRAQAVIDYVVNKGIDRTRLTPVPLGSEAAVGDNATAEGQAQNRSVAFVITGLLA